MYNLSICIEISRHHMNLILSDWQTLARANRCGRIKQQHLWANVTQNQEHFPTAGHQFEDIRGIKWAAYMLETNVNAKFLLRKNKQFSQTFSSLNKKDNTNRMFYIYLVKSFNTKMIFKRFQEFCVRIKIDTSNTELMFEFIFTYIFVDTLRF